MNLLETIKTVLIRFKIRHYQDIEGWLSPNEAIALYRFASLLPRGSTIVEIGVWKGRSTYCLARGLRDGEILAIDPFDASSDEESHKLYLQKKGEKPLIDQFKKNMERLKVVDKIEILEGPTSRFAGQIPKIDLLFIDGDHSKEVCEFDFLNYSPMIPSGGYLILHDFDDSRKELGPTWVVQNIILPSKEFKFVGLFDLLWVGKRL